jgi:hypothetical protein
VLAGRATGSVNELRHPDANRHLYLADDGSLAAIPEEANWRK